MNQKNRTQQKVELQVLADKPVFACGAASERILEIRVSSPERDESKERAPLNLSFVLDRSGSMQGDKLQFVKQAAAHVIGLLGEKNRASVVTYDDHVNVLTPQNWCVMKISEKQPSRYRKFAQGGVHFCQVAGSSAVKKLLSERLNKPSTGHCFLLTAWRMQPSPG